MKLLGYFLLCAGLVVGSTGINQEGRNASNNGAAIIITSFTIDTHLTIRAGLAGTNTTVFRFEGDIGLQLSYGLSPTDPDTLTCLTRGGATGPSVNVGDMVYARVRCRREIGVATPTYTIQVWNEQTGTYRTASIVDPTPTAYTLPSGNFWLGGQFATVAYSGDTAFIRIYGVAFDINAPAPVRLLTSGFANIADWEFEASLLDFSPSGRNLSMNVGTATYPTTTVLPPKASFGSVPTTIRTETTQLLTASALVNEDNNNVTGEWALVNSANKVPIQNSLSLTGASITPVLFGEYNINLGLTTATYTGVTSSLVFGAVPTDNRGIVVLPRDTPAQRAIADLLGQFTRIGANPWNWEENRVAVAADAQIAMQSTFWANPWDTPNGIGTISVTYGNNIVTGVGTQFQTQFCGGGTVPTSPTNAIAVFYNSATYPGTTGRAFYPVKACPSQTSIELGFVGGNNRDWAHATGTQTGLSYWVPSNTEWTWWTSSGTPGNYYDNGMGFYRLHYRTGLTKYLNAARTLMDRWWRGPFYDRGQNYNIPLVGGNFISAGPARGQSILGLIIYYFDTGVNVWPGLDNVYAWFTDAGYNFFFNNGWLPRIGDLREDGYMLGYFGACAQYHPDGLRRADCLTKAKNLTNLLWFPRQQPAGNFNFTPSRVSWYNTTGVNVVNGSANVTLTGAAAWDGREFEPDSWGWFFTNVSTVYLTGNTNAEAGGENVYYKFTRTSDTTATLDRPYVGVSGNKGALFSNLVALGVQPFQLGITGASMAGTAYDAMVATGNPLEAGRLLNMATGAVNWLTSTGGDATRQIYTGRVFLNCEPAGSNPDQCGAGVALNGEVMQAYSWVQLRNGSAATLTAGDEYYTRQWCKPTGGWTCGTPGYPGVYLNDIDTVPGSGGYMIDPAVPTTNKWLGFFWGFGGTANWPAARQGGLEPADIQTSAIMYEAPAGTISTSIQIVESDTSTETTACSTGSGFRECTVSYDRRLQKPLFKIIHQLSGSVRESILTLLNTPQ